MEETRRQHPDKLPVTHIPSLFLPRLPSTFWVETAWELTFQPNPPLSKQTRRPPEEKELFCHIFKGLILTSQGSTSFACLYITLQTMGTQDIHQKSILDILLITMSLCMTQYCVALRHAGRSLLLSCFCVSWVLSFISKGYEDYALHRKKRYVTGQMSQTLEKVKLRQSPRLHAHG